jgi:UPF0176 protein
MPASTCTTPGSIVIAALYKFVRLEDPAAVRGPLAKLCCAQGVKGTLLLAREGINGTIAGSRDGIDAVLAHIRALPGCAQLEHKESFATDMPFHRMKVRLKREIVTMGVDDIDPNLITGTYVEPEDWNALISDPDTVVIDTRNDYEHAIGTFEGAIDPDTKSSASSRTGSGPNTTSLPARRSPCSAPAASAAKNPPRSQGRPVQTRSITSRAAS